jgi:hypothetical protein
VGAPGTGKSRLAQSVGCWLQDCSNKELGECAEKDTLSVHITFNNDSKYDIHRNLDGKYATCSLGSRALASYFGSNWRKLCDVVDVKFMPLDLCLEVIVDHHRRSKGPNDSDTPTILYLAVDDVGSVVRNDVHLPVPKLPLEEVESIFRGNKDVAPCRSMWEPSFLSVAGRHRSGCGNI